MSKGLQSPLGSAARELYLPTTNTNSLEGFMKVYVIKATQNATTDAVQQADLGECKEMCDKLIDYLQNDNFFI